MVAAKGKIFLLRKRLYLRYALFVSSYFRDAQNLISTITMNHVRHGEIKLTSSGVYFGSNTPGVSYSELFAFLYERYGEPQRQDDPEDELRYAFFYTKDAKTVILLEQTTYKGIKASHVQYTENLQ